LKRNATAQQLTMQALFESEQRISSILASAMDTIITIDYHQDITLFNAAAVKPLTSMCE